jgi:hypothetical protein
VGTYRLALICGQSLEQFEYPPFLGQRVDALQIVVVEDQWLKSGFTSCSLVHQATAMCVDELVAGDREQPSDREVGILEVIAVDGNEHSGEGLSHEVHGNVSSPCTSNEVAQQ